MIDETVYIAEGAKIIGNVSIKEYSSVWYNAVIRGDRTKIQVGKFTNIQDLCIIHGGERHNVKIGDFCTIGHGSKIHGAEVGNKCLIGMGSTLMNGAKIGDGSVIQAASVVTENTTIPAGSIAIGNPAKVVRQLNPDEIECIKQNALEYKALAAKAKKIG